MYIYTHISWMPKTVTYQKYERVTAICNEWTSHAGTNEYIWYIIVIHNLFYRLTQVWHWISNNSITDVENICSIILDLFRNIWLRESRFWIKQSPLICWRHDMETFSHYWPRVRGIDWWPVSNHQPHHCLRKAQTKENINALRHWPLCGEFTGDRWIPRTNGQ